MKVYFNNSCKICRSEINLYKKEKVEEIEDEDDEFSFVFDEEKSESLVEESLVEVSVEEVVIDIDDEVDSSASGRLAALRNEMDGDEEKNLTREERMNRFFADK